MKKERLFLISDGTNFRAGEPAEVVGVKRVTNYSPSITFKSYGEYNAYIVVYEDGKEYYFRTDMEGKEYELRVLSEFTTIPIKD